MGLFWVQNESNQMQTIKNNIFSGSLQEIVAYIWNIF